MIEKRGTVVADIRPEEFLFEADHNRIAIGRIEGLVEANNTELVPLLSDDVVSVKSGTERVLEKLQKLIVLGKIRAMCLVIVAVFVVLGVIIMLFK